MKKRIGIPKGLLYYDYFPLWIKFFEGLGAEVVVSRGTNKHILEKGVKNIIDEVCLPVKVFNGHIIELIDLHVDYIFVPKIMSIYAGEYICPKFCGLPELIKSSIKDLPPIIDTKIDFYKSKNKLLETVYEIGSYVTKDEELIEYSFEKAMEDYYEYRRQIKQGALPIDLVYSPGKSAREPRYHKSQILLLGHSYNIYDPYTSMNLIEKLRRQGMDVLTADNISTPIINEKAKSMDKKMFWSFGRKLLGAAFYAMEQKEVCGIIYLSSFGCGLDSVIADIIERRVRRNTNKPFAMLTIDEHTGEAGIDTRIEAFVDMIRWRGTYENNFSPYGEYLHIH